MVTIEQINQKYIDSSQGVFPFLSKYRITVLTEGFYTLMDAPYMGIRYVNDRQKKAYRALLIGFHYVPQNTIIVPSEMEMCLSYWAKARFYEERKDYRSAEWNEAKYLEHYYQVKRLYNFKNALYMSAKINESFSPTNY